MMKNNRELVERKISEGRKQGIYMKSMVSRRTAPLLPMSAVAVAGGTRP